MGLHNGFVLHFHLESRLLQVFSWLCHGQPALPVDRGKTHSPSLLPVAECVSGTFWDFRESTVWISEQRFGIVLILSQLILFSWGSGMLSAFEWDETHLKTVTLQVSEKSQILLETNIFNYIWHSHAYCCHFSTTDGNRLGNVQHN